MNLPQNDKSVTELLVGLANDPLRFVKLCWPDMKLYHKQMEIMLSVRDNRQTFVPAANQTGKSRTAALVSAWFYATRSPGQVIITSSSEAQLNQILWNELLGLIHASCIPLPWIVKNLNIRKRQHPDSTDTVPRDYLVGHVPQMTESFQGHHLPSDRPRVLAVFDEASGVPDELFDASDSWAHRMLVIGNPLSNENFFYRYCKRGNQPDPADPEHLLCKVIPIDGRDSPNVQAGFRWHEAKNAGKPPVLIPGLLTYEDFLRRELDWDETKKTPRLYGRFYEGEHARLFPDAWLDRAMDPLQWERLQAQERKPTALGIDVAHGGGDMTCWTLVDEFGLIEQIVMDLSNAMEIVGRTKRLIEDHQISRWSVAIDAGGGGAQIADRLAEQNLSIQRIAFGESPDDRQAYKNRRAELYGHARRLLQPEGEEDEQVFALPPFAVELRQELAVLPIHYDSEGRLTLPPKNHTAGKVSLRQLLGHSPDRADSFVLAMWALSLGAKYQATYDYELLCWPAGVPIDLTPEELAAAPPELRELIEMKYDRPDDDDYWDERAFW